MRNATRLRGPARGLLGVVLAVACVAAQAQFDGMRDESRSEPAAQAVPNAPDGETVKLPAYPQEDDLVGFFVSSANDFEFFIDGKSIAIDRGVVRYTLVARSPEGTANVSFEGIRCSSSEYRIYAIGHPDKRWAASTTPWRKIEPASVQRWRYALLQDYFCPGGAPILTVGGGIDALQRGRHSLIDQSDRF